jgi:hypothetical protein
MIDPHVKGDCCNNCIFWEYYEERFAVDDEGNCKRFPPVLVPLRNGDGAWTERVPKTEANDWCGEFRPSKNAKAPGDRFPEFLKKEGDSQ